MAAGALFAAGALGPATGHALPLAVSARRVGGIEALRVETACELCHLHPQLGRAASSILSARIASATSAAELVALRDDIRAIAAELRAPSVTVPHGPGTVAGGPALVLGRRSMASDLGAQLAGHRASPVVQRGIWMESPDSD